MTPAASANPTLTLHRRHDSPWWLGLTLVLLIAGALRLTTLGVPPFWLDEMHTLLNSAANRAAFEALPNGRLLAELAPLTRLDAESSLGAVWRDLRADAHPPLDFLILHLWRRVVGDGEFAVRLPSVLWSVLSLIPLALILRAYGAPRAGLLAAGILALAYSHILLGQQARPYSLALLLASTGFWLLVHLDPSATIRRRLSPLWTGVGLAACVALGLLTHYLTCMVFAAQGLFALLRLREAARTGALAGLVGGLVAFALLWGPSLAAQQRFIAGQHWLRDVGSGAPVRAAVRAADIPVRLLLRTPQHDWSRPGPYLQAFLGVGLLAGAAWVLRHRPAPAALPFALWTAVPLVALLAADLVRGTQMLTHLRYSVLIGPGLVGLFVLTAERLPRPAQLVSVLGFVSLAALTLNPPALRSAKTPGLALTIANVALPDAVLVVDAREYLTDWARQAFLPVWHYLGKPPFPVVLLVETPEAALLAELAGHQRIVILSPRGEVQNVCPETHHFAQRTPFVPDAGAVFVLERRPLP